MIVRVVALLAAHIAAGTLFIAAVLSVSHRLPDSFLRFCAALSIAGSSIALLAIPESRISWLVLCIGSVAWYLHIKRQQESRSWFGWLMILTSILAVAPFGWQFSEQPILGVLGSFTSALLLGSVCVTMILGHWYLVDVHLSLAPLRQGAWWLWLGVLGRLATVAAVLAMGGWSALNIGRAADIIFSTAGLFFMFRSLVGLGAPILMAGLIWQTVKIRSTQSATGLLYVALMLVLFGELISHFLLLTTGFPL